MSFLDYDSEPIKCECQDCGKTWNKGDEGDNETTCLRCERLFWSVMDDIENEEN